MPFPQNMNGEFIAPQKGSWEPQRTNNWSFVVDLASLGLQGVNGTAGASSGVQVLQMSVNTATAPTFTLDKAEIAWFNEKRKVATVPSFEGGSFSFIDYLDEPVFYILWKWFEKGYNPVTGQVGLARDYKTKGTITLLRPDGWGGHNYNSPRQFQLQGLWISSLNPTSGLDYNSPDISKIEVTFEWDKAVPTGASLTPIDSNRFKWDINSPGDTRMNGDTGLLQSIGG